MITVIVAVCALTVFTTMQAFYWRAAAQRAASVELLRARLRLPDDDGIVRARDQADALAVMLAQSGLEWTKTDFLRRAAVVALGLGLLGALRDGFFAGVLCAAIGAGGVYAFVAYKRRERLELVSAQIPRALELMTLTLRSGHALPRAVAVVAKETPAPTGLELRRVAEETELGRPVEEAFAAMNRRLPGVVPLRALVTGINVLGKSGGNLIEVIERIVEFAGQQAQFRQRVKALTAENRASGFILAALPPGFAVMATIVSPGYFDVLGQTSMGRLMALLAFAFWVMGVLWIRSMTELED